MPAGPCLGFFVVDNKDDDDDDNRGNKFGRRCDSSLGGSCWSGKRGSAAAAAAANLNKNHEVSDRDDDGSSVFARLRARVIAKPRDVSSSSSSSSGKRLRPEKRFCNLVDREEGTVVQYLALGGYRHYVTGNREFGPPDRLASNLHAGPGQLTFGWSRQQRADLTLIYFGDSQFPSRVYHHNHHGSFWHYRGHVDSCCLADRTRPELAYVETVLSKRCDEFRRGLADRLTAVAPDKVVFCYSVTTSCDLIHGNESKPPSVGSTLPGSETKHFTARAALVLERDDEAFLPYKKQTLDAELLKRQIARGLTTGFVTLKGGREADCWKNTASGQFGFCVQQYAAAADDLSPYTKKQICLGEGFKDDDDFRRFVESQPARTLNAKSFLAQETVSTSYLRWLMNERGFCDFSITHFMAYKFVDWPKAFLEPVLQTRHEKKMMGDTVAAECLKLVGNGSFGYNGLEANNYTRTRLMTLSTLQKRRKRDMAELTLKHITLIGVTKVKSKKKMDGRSAKKGRCEFVAHEAVDEDDCEGNNDDDDEDDEFDESREIEAILGCSVENKDDDDDDDDSVDPDNWTLEPLYSVEISGQNRRLFNNLPKAVAVLSNSKRLFFGHLATMLECFDPRLAELCYIDTDSCIWSLTYRDVLDNVLPSARQRWLSGNLLADERGLASCHGKMKLEGMFSAGLFRSPKIYRLFGSINGGDNDDDENAVYTRCKGVSRRMADRLDHSVFCSDDSNQVTVHRNTLRPSRTGEIVLAHERRSLAVSYNYKRFVTSDGVHTFPFDK